jgi:multiple sugar transport system permease protein
MSGEMSARSLPVGPAAPALSARLPAPIRALDPDRGWRWATFGPALALMVALSALPLLNLLWTSFHNVSWAEGRATWMPVGFVHYRALADDELFRAGLGNTTVFALAAVAGQMVLGFFLALLCSRVTRGRVLYRAIFILPILIPGIVIGAIWKLMLNYDFGLANQFIGLIGLEPRDWLGDAGTALLSVVVVDIWHWTPFCFLLFLAGLESLPQDVYEAARIDGATAWQELVFVTLPMMLPTILVTFAFRLVLAFKVFDEVYLLTSGGPGTATEVVSFTLYQRFFTEDRVGYGAAMAVAVIFLVSLLLVLALSARRRTEAGA